MLQVYDAMSFRGHLMQLLFFGYFLFVCFGSVIATLMKFF